jgi:hypothetical protein
LPRRLSDGGLGRKALGLGVGERRIGLTPAGVERRPLQGADFGGEAFIFLRLPRLALQPTKAGVKLAHHVAQARKIGLRRLQAKVCFVSPAV